MNSRFGIIIQLLSDLGARPDKKGAALGPSALLNLDMEKEKLFSSIPVVCVQHSACLDENKSENTWLRHGKLIYDFLEQASQVITKSLNEQKIPLIMSGDHSNAVAGLSALRNTFKEKKIGVIWIDAHADIHSPYTTPSGNLHGMALGMAVDTHLENSNQRNLTSDEFSLWQSLKHISGNTKSITDVKNILYLGVRSFEPEEDEICTWNGVAKNSPRDLRDLGDDKTALMIENFSNQFDLIYVSFDIDSLDKQYVPGTGTPVSEGFTPNEAGKLLHQLIRLPNLAAFEITEINPKVESQVTLKNVYHVLKLGW